MAVYCAPIGSVPALPINMHTMSVLSCQYDDDDGETFAINLLIYGGRNLGISYKDVRQISIRIPKPHTAFPPELLQMSAGKWNVGESLPSVDGQVPSACRNLHTATKVRGLLYIFGGRNSANLHGRNDLYALDTRTMRWRLIRENWTNEPDWPPPRYAHAAAAIGTSIFMFGGYHGAYLDDMWVFDTTSEEWFVPTLDDPEGVKPCARYGHTLIPLRGQRIALIGGRGQDGLCDDAWLLHLGLCTVRWEKISTEGIDKSCLQRYYHCACAVDGGHAVVLFGGCSATDYLNDVVKISFMRFRTLQPSPSASSLASSSPGRSPPASPPPLAPPHKPNDSTPMVSPTRGIAVIPAFSAQNHRISSSPITHTTKVGTNVSPPATPRKTPMHTPPHSHSFMRHFSDSSQRLRGKEGRNESPRTVVSDRAGGESGVTAVGAYAMECRRCPVVNVGGRDLPRVGCHQAVCCGHFLIVQGGATPMFHDNMAEPLLLDLRPILSKDPLGDCLAVSPVSVMAGQPPRCVASATDPATCSDATVSTNDVSSVSSTSGSEGGHVRSASITDSIAVIAAGVDRLGRMHTLTRQHLSFPKKLCVLDWGLRQHHEDLLLRLTNLGRKLDECLVSLRFHSRAEPGRRVAASEKRGMELLWEIAAVTPRVVMLDGAVIDNDLLAGIVGATSVSADDTSRLLHMLRTQPVLRSFYKVLRWRLNALLLVFNILSAGFFAAGAEGSVDSLASSLDDSVESSLDGNPAPGVSLEAEHHLFGLGRGQITSSILLQLSLSFLLPSDVALLSRRCTWVHADADQDIAANVAVRVVLDEAVSGPGGRLQAVKYGDDATELAVRSLASAVPALASAVDELSALHAETRGSRPMYGTSDVLKKGALAEEIQRSKGMDFRPSPQFQSHSPYMHSHVDTTPATSSLGQMSTEGGFGSRASSPVPVPPSSCEVVTHLVDEPVTNAVFEDLFVRHIVGHIFL
eukprot:Rmarinus@m.2643